MQRFNKYRGKKVFSLCAMMFLRSIRKMKLICLCDKKVSINEETTNEYFAQSLNYVTWACVLYYNYNTQHSQPMKMRNELSLLHHKTIQILPRRQTKRSNDLSASCIGATHSRRSSIIVLRAREKMHLFGMIKCSLYSNSSVLHFLVFEKL